MNDGNQYNNQLKSPARGVAFGEVTKNKKGISNPPSRQVENVECLVNVNRGVSTLFTEIKVKSCRTNK